MSLLIVPAMVIAIVALYRFACPRRWLLWLAGSTAALSLPLGVLDTRETVADEPLRAIALILVVVLSPVLSFLLLAAVMRLSLLTLERSASRDGAHQVRSALPFAQRVHGLFVRCENRPLRES